MIKSNDYNHRSLLDCIEQFSVFNLADLKSSAQVDENIFDAARHAITSADGVDQTVQHLHVNIFSLIQSHPIQITHLLVTDTNKLC